MPQLTDLTDQQITCHVRYGQVVITYDLDLGKMTLEQQFTMSGLADKLQRAIDNPDSTYDLKQLKKALGRALVPVVCAWDLYATAADEAAGRAIPIGDDTMGALPGPVLLAMSGTLRKLTASDEDDDGPEAFGAS